MVDPGRTRTRLPGRAGVLLLAGLLAWGLCSTGQARAGSAARGTATATVGTATWSVTPTTVDTLSPAPGQVALTFSSCTLLVLCPPPQYFWFVNTGTTTLSGATYTFGSNGVNVGSFAITACLNGSWVSGSCTGTTAALTSGAATTVVPTAPGTRLQVQVKVNSVLSLKTTITGSAQVSSSSPRQIRAATTTTG